MNWDILLFVASISFLGMVSPGPDFFFVLKGSLSYSRKTALWICFGIVMGIFTHMFYCVAGIAVLITATPWLYTLLRYAGAGYLIYLGIKSLFAKGSGINYVENTQRLADISYKKAFLQGYLCNLLNPKATLFFLAIFTQVLSIDSTLVDKLFVAFVIWIEAVLWWPCVVFVFQSQAVQRRYLKMQLLIDKSLGLILIALGIKVALGV